MRKKKTLSVIISILLAIALCACGSGGQASLSESTQSEAPEEPKEEKVETVTLTKDNVEQYIAFEGSFIDSDYEDLLGIMYVASSTIDFQAYNTKAGSLSDVEITLKVDMPSNDQGALDEKWHLKDSEEESNIYITFKMPASGEYKSTYAITCNRCTAKPSGKCQFSVDEVKGTFTPS